MLRLPSLRSQKFESKSRRGMTLLAVMVTLSATAVLAIAFLQEQIVALKVAENRIASDRAAEAASAGLSAAIDAMQSPTWAGVENADRTPRVLSGILLSDSRGTARYEVQFVAPVRGADVPADIHPAALALRCKLVSTGFWVETGRQRPFTRTMTAILNLTPRLPGRTVGPGDSAARSDLKPIDATFTSSVQSTLLADDAGQSAALPPLCRVEGELWLNGDLTVFSGVSWSSSIRDQTLKEFGELLGGTIWHPLPGQVRFAKNQTVGNNDPLGSNRLKVNWQSNVPAANRAAWDVNKLKSYQLFAGGRTYFSQRITSSSIGNVTLGPSDENPLGIYHSDGSIRLDNNLILRGTLLAAGDITLKGRGIKVVAFDGTDGTTAVWPDADKWPRLPALIAGNDVIFSSGCGCVITGSMLVNRGVTGAGTSGNTHAAVTVNGPISCRYLSLTGHEDWGDKAASWWNSQNFYWNFLTNKESPFVAWLTVQGLPFEPNIVFSRPSNVSYACEPPLLRADPDSSAGGFVWAILRWESSP